ncbi:MAG: acyl transferase [Sphingobacteriaceae bacterium]
MNYPEQAAIFSIKTETEFTLLVWKIFHFQAKHCGVYRNFIKNLKIDVTNIRALHQIPFLPIEFFKTQQVISFSHPAAVTFRSSGTTGVSTSKHLVADISWYETSFRQGFIKIYGDIKHYVVLALLPSYQEREGSSLIYMVEDLIRKSGQMQSGFFLNDDENLRQTLRTLRESGQPTILIGVTFALLDFIEQEPIEFPELIIMETGGMKGRRKEMIRQALHQQLCAGFGVNDIHSEYGMTELLSQAYSRGNGLFHCPPWMRILIRDTNDPLTLLNSGQTGGINVIDLANVYSCSFIATQDLGKIISLNTFEVIGRFDNADIRGCNLLVG